ncbi:MAG: hypothetical protein LBR35_01830 [Rickettsiales bacterium]|jgi:hypothetical protein|nr:hypothetical protein [Rickettsiales bacterium]
MRGVKIIFLYFLFVCFSLNAQVEMAVNYLAVPNLGALSEISGFSKSLEYKGIIHSMVQRFFNNGILINDGTASYSDLLEGALDGKFENKPVDIIGGIYYDEKNLKYLMYVPVPVATDNMLIAFKSDLKSTYRGISEVEVLQNSDANLIIIEGMDLNEIIVNKTFISFKSMEECINEILENNSVFVGSERMLRNYVEKNPDVKSKIAASHLKKDDKIVKRRLFFAFNRDFLSVQKNENLVKEFGEFLRNYRNQN